MLQLQFIFEDNTCILRFLPLGSTDEQIDSVQENVCAQLAAALQPAPAFLRRTSNEVFRRTLQQRDLHFTNLCGRVLHCDRMRAVHPHMRMLFRSTTNDFGSFLHLSHLDGNLVTSYNRTTTLFRAGRDSQKVMDLLREVFDFENVSDVHLHMCVCAAHLGKPVRVAAGYNETLDSAFTKDSQLQVRLDYSNEEMSAVKVICIDALDPALLNGLLGDCEAARPRQVLVHVGSLGFINIFAVMQANTKLTIGLERRLMPLFEFLLAKIDRVT